MFLVFSPLFIKFGKDSYYIGVGLIILCPFKHLRKLGDTKSLNLDVSYYFYI